MADIKNKNELRRRIDLFLDDFSHEEYIINELFCKETMRMMREFIGHASHLLDCADAKIKKAKRTERNKTIEEFAELLRLRIKAEIDDCADELDWIDEIAEEMRGTT